MTEVNRKIHVVGINSYKFEDLSFKLQNLFQETVSIAVPNSYFEEIKSWSENDLEKKKSFFTSNSNHEIVNWLRSQKTDVILISRGDPLWFGIGRILLENFSKDELIFYPSNTCIQIAFSKLKIPWQDTVNVSIHGRDSTRLVEALKARPSSLAIITDSNNKSLEIIQKNLSELNLIDFYDFWLCEEIGFDNENIRKLNLKESLPSDISSLNIVVLTKTKKNYSNENLPLLGISDHIFKTFDDRPNLFTKREVRVQILADLELPKNGIIWDIGAGCGSIGLEAIKLRPNLDLVCIDKRIGSKSLIQIEGLKELAFPINDVPGNCTRFVLLSKESNSNSANIASFAFSLISNKPGALLKALNYIADFGFNMSKIESRPSKRELGEYIIYIDLEINDQNNIKNFLNLKNKLKPLCKNFVDFGNYLSENVELD